jgi:DNA polymerase III epsilon subunit-like protein
MCEEFPGPRCSYDAAKKVQARQRRLLEAQEKFGANSHQALLAQARYDKAVEEYDATPEGIQALTTQIATDPTDNIATRRLYVGESIRALQTNALKEIKMQRVSNLAFITSGIKDFYDAEEAESIITSNRENAEKYKFYKNAKPIDYTSDEEHYAKYVENLKIALHNKFEGKVPAEYTKAVEALKDMPAPDGVNMGAYDSLPRAFDTSRRQMISEIRNAAALQGVSPKIAAEYYEAYRKQYKDNFASLPTSERPDPPENWVRGEFANSGYAKDFTSSFAPHDPASMYAIYRLRADQSAIPDYMKQSQAIASIDLETAGPEGREGFEPENGRIIEVGIKIYSPNGKVVGTVDQLIKPEESFLQAHGTGAMHIHKISPADLEGKPDWRTISPQISNALKGKILLAQYAPFEKKWLTHHLSDFSKDTPVIDTMEISRKHYDLPDNKLETICNNIGVPYTNGHRAMHDAEAAGDVYFKQRKAIQKMWATKTARKKAPALTVIPSNSRWMAKKPI